jgi:hypothetical protein
MVSRQTAWLVAIVATLTVGDILRAILVSLAAQHPNGALA